MVGFSLMNTSSCSASVRPPNTSTTAAVTTGMTGSRRSIQNRTPIDTAIATMNAAVAKKMPSRAFATKNRINGPHSMRSRSGEILPRDASPVGAESMVPQMIAGGHRNKVRPAGPRLRPRRPPAYLLRLPGAGKPETPVTTALMPTYDRADVAFERGAGAYVRDTAGRRYLDFSGGVAVLSLGHCHPHLVEALRAQAERLWHTSNLFRVPGQERLARRLVECSFADTVFFANSGAEAVECGLKLVRKHFDAVGDPDRYRVLTFEGGFHGRTLAAVSAGRKARHLAGFEPAVEGFDQAPWGDLDAARAAVTDRTAAILVEPVQGEAGVRVPPAGFLRGLRSLCDERGVLLFLDEVQTGIGRTGRLFAHEHEGVTPDVMAVAKGLGGGFPIGACLATRDAAVGMTPGSHGSTFGGNPLAMAVGNAVLDVVLAEGFLEGVRSVAADARRRLAPLVDAGAGVFSELRASGLLLGLRCRPPHAEVAGRLRALGLLVAVAGDDVIRLAPPLIVGEAEIGEASALLADVAGARPS